MTYTCVQKQYCLELTDDEWSATLVLDAEDMSTDLDRYIEDYIVDRSLEFNGHFGQNLWFSVGEENFKDVAKIERMIRKFLRDVEPTGEELW